MTGVLRGLFFVFLAGIGATTLVGLLARNFPAVVNGIVSIAASFLPRIVERSLTLETGTEIAFGPELPAWIAFAGFLHMLGMLGWYDTVRWWDHVTHTVSAALVAVLVYAGAHTYSHYALESQLPNVYAALFTVLFTLAVGVLWEFIEIAARELGEYIGKPPVLEYYGLRDTVLDTIFNGVGALVVVAFDIRVFVPVTDQLPRLVGRIVFWGTVLLFAGTLAIGVLLERFASVIRNPGRP
jgi:hypothetical protein